MKKNNKDVNTFASSTAKDNNTPKQTSDIVLTGFRVKLTFKNVPPPHSKKLKKIDSDKI